MGRYTTCLSRDVSYISSLYVDKLYSLWETTFVKNGVLHVFGTHLGNFDASYRYASSVSRDVPYTSSPDVDKFYRFWEATFVKNGVLPVLGTHLHLFEINIGESIIIIRDCRLMLVVQFGRDESSRCSNRTGGSLSRHSLICKVGYTALQHGRWDDSTNEIVTAMMRVR